MDNKYINWKDWNTNSFGKVSKLDGAYFRNLVKVLKIKKSTKILEVGYGNGSFLGYMSRKGFNIWGVEINNNLVDLAKKHNFITFDSMDKIDANVKFDLIVLFDVLEHIPGDDVENFLQTISFYLQDSGAIFLRFPNGSSPLGLENQHGDITHCNIITMPKLIYWCSNFNLTATFVRGDIRPFIFRHNLKKMPSRLLRRVLYFIAEKFTRLISIQSKGILSSNLEVILERK
jgi:2-polyprenyl-3-methyl-5-hydroxy-6-metoxy-1,4-benzoquinol methylase